MTTTIRPSLWETQLHQQVLRAHAAFEDATYQSPLREGLTFDLALVEPAPFDRVGARDAPRFPFSTQATFMLHRSLQQGAGYQSQVWVARETSNRTSVQDADAELVLKFIIPSQLELPWEGMTEDDISWASYIFPEDVVAYQAAAYNALAEHQGVTFQSAVETITDAHAADIRHCDVREVHILVDVAHGRAVIIDWTNDALAHLANTGLPNDFIRTAFYDVLEISSCIGTPEVFERSHFPTFFPFLPPTTAGLAQVPPALPLSLDILTRGLFRKSQHLHSQRLTILRVAHLIVVLLLSLLLLHLLRTDASTDSVARRRPRQKDIVAYQAAAYNALAKHQGGTVPYFYGAHKITAPWGEPVSVLALEYIHGPCLWEMRAALDSDAPHNTAFMEYQDYERYLSLFQSAMKTITDAHDVDIQHCDIRDAHILVDIAHNRA
ncbi:hypothetical protein BD626DRAFT_630293 [Schizophyllum amplum]|uniref:Protein kinase domain-containing protein n=1 Tax=Schizophyllum amplum TaxID=97359 RepID=A0A550CEB5_9AGAR|nr:hypothetical protein BD626DRAFT_630293 [Auriculariopsis ampla]